MLDLKAVFGYPSETPEAEATADTPGSPDVLTLPGGPDTATLAETSGQTTPDVPNLEAEDTEAATPAESPDDFAGWVRRPDCKGQMGWEPAELPEAARWWARWDFDNLPEPVWPGYLGDPRKPALLNRPQSTEAGPADPQYVGGNRPIQAILGASAGCEVGRGPMASGGRRRQAK